MKIWQYAWKQAPMLALLVLLGAGAGILVNETVAEPRVSYLGWSREAQLLAASRTGHLLPLRPAPLAEAPAGISHASGGKLLVHLFYSSSCPDCAIFRDKILPDLETTYADHVIFLEHDTQTEEGVKLLFTYLDKYQVKATRASREATLKMFMYNRYLLGTDEAATRAMVEIAAALAALWEKGKLGSAPNFPRGV